MRAGRGPAVRRVLPESEGAGAVPPRDVAPVDPWHALFAPLPDEAIPRRHPVGPPEILATPEGAAVAGWEQLTVELSAGAAGMRMVLVVLDASGRPISASDMVFYRFERSEGVGRDARPVVEYEQQSVGGRLESDDTFRGTRWRAVAVERPGAEEEPRWESTPSEPSEADVAGIMALVAEVLRRLPPQSC